MITEADVTEFQELYQKRFGSRIDKDAAYKKLSLLVRQVEIVYQPITMGQLDQYMNEHGVSNGETKQESRQNTHRD